MKFFKYIITLIKYRKEIISLVHQFVIKSGEIELIDKKLKENFKASITHQPKLELGIEDGKAYLNAKSNTFDREIKLIKQQIKEKYGPKQPNIN